MRVMDFLQHYGLNSNPFSEEDAQTDPVFKDTCINTTHHPAWDKLYGSPAIPATSLAFGEKGSGKTALRLQMIRELTNYNTDHQTDRPLVVDYSDLNPFLDRFQNRSPRWWKTGKLLSKYELSDHLDSMLSLAVTQLVDRILCPTECSHPAAIDVNPIDISKLNDSQFRDLLALTTVYDRSRGEATITRVNKLMEKRHFFTWKLRCSVLKEFLIGVAGTLILPFLFYECGIVLKGFWWLFFGLFFLWSFWLVKFFARNWKAASIQRAVRVHDIDKQQVRKVLMGLPNPDYLSFPVPKGRNQEKRYELLDRFLTLLHPLGFNGMIVIMDRIDEPYIIHGEPDSMKSVVWPLLDNKLLKHNGIGIKALWPDELYRFIRKESESFHQRSRLDKQNLITSLSWTGDSLIDLVNARVTACSSDRSDGKKTAVTDFFNPEEIGESRLRTAFATLKVPRHLLKFLNELIITHVGSCTETNPMWTISALEFETSLSSYLARRADS